MLLLIVGIAWLCGVYVPTWLLLTVVVISLVDGRRSR
jgi:hypothetical protein